MSERGMLLEVIDITASKGWAQALKRVKRDEFGKPLGEAIIAAMHARPASEAAFTDALRLVCTSHEMDWEQCITKLSSKAVRHTFVYVRLPVDDKQAPEELSAETSGWGDQLFSLLKARFAATAPEVGTADASSSVDRLAQLASVELFALCRPSCTTWPVAHTGTYFYFDEIGAIKQLPQNARAFALAQACGCEPTSPFHGDVFIGRVATQPSPARQASFPVAELELTSEWVRRAPAENAAYSAVLDATAPPPPPPPDNDELRQQQQRSQDEQARSLMHTMFTGLRAPLPRTVCLREGVELQIESTCRMERARSDDPTGAVVWDCGLVTCAHLAHAQKLGACSEFDLAGKRVLELGAGTGIVGLACLKLGARSACLTDLDSQLEPIRRNARLNGCAIDEEDDEAADEAADEVAEGGGGHHAAESADSGVGRVDVTPLVWTADSDWQVRYPRLAARVAAHEFDLIIASDCVYGTEPSAPFARVLLELLEANPSSRLLFAYEERPLPASEINHGAEFFELMEQAGCVLTRVEAVEGEERTRAAISLWRGAMGKG